MLSSKQISRIILERKTIVHFYFLWIAKKVGWHVIKNNTFFILYSYLLLLKLQSVWLQIIMPRSPDGGRMRPGSPNGNCKWADTEWAQAAQLDWVHFSFEEAPQLLETEHFILTTRRKSFCPLSFFCKISQRSMWLSGKQLGSIVG